MKTLSHNSMIILCVLLISSCNQTKSTDSDECIPLTFTPTNVPAPEPLVIITPPDQNITQDAKVQALLNKMTQEGVHIRLLGESQVAFLENSAPGLAYRINDGDQLFIHVFTHRDLATKFAKSIPEDADTGSTEWAAPPHFFLCDTMIVVYVGRSTIIMNSLIELCGSQFAGNR